MNRADIPLESSGVGKRLPRAMALGTLVGFTAGLAGGLGARTAMRIIAMVAGPSALGAITQNGNVVGRITLGGSLFLVVFGGFVGVLFGILYMAVRPWLAWSGAWRGLVFGVVLLLIFGSVIINNSNPDFTRFGLPGLNILLFSSLPIFFGLLVSALVDRLDRSFPLPARRIRTLVAYGLLAVPFFFGALLVIVGLLLGGRLYPSLAFISIFAYRLFVVPVRENRYANYAGYAIIGFLSTVGLLFDIQAMTGIVNV